MKNDREITAVEQVGWLGAAIVAAVGLMLLLAGCEKGDLGENSGTGTPVEILFSVGGRAYEAGGEVLRGAGEGAGEAVMVPLVEGLYLCARLLPVGEGLRANPVLGQKIRLTAYEDGTNADMGSADYQADGNGNIVAEGGNPLMIETGKTCHFMAYSYNSTTQYPALVDVDPGNDLLWGKTSNALTVKENNRTVEINMAHKFSRITVRVRAVGNFNGEITAIEDLEIVGGTLTTVNVLSGATSTGSPVQQLVSWPENFPSTDISSIPRTVSPLAAGPVEMKIGRIEVAIDDEETTYSLNNLTAKFSTPLAVGSEYTLVVDLKRTRWAQSNIYWDSELNDGDGGLTFDAGTTTKSMCQGVFFKYGSLVGISPNGAWADGSTRVYWPTGENAFEATTATSWGAIPSMNLSGASYNTGSYVLGQGNDWSAGTGDICNFIDGRYRLPTTGELNHSNSTDPELFYQQGWERIGHATNWSDVASTGDDGHYLFGIGAAIPAQGVVFPASGDRNVNGALPSSSEETGSYWSGSVQAANTGYCLKFADGSVYPTAEEAGANAFAVRCIKK